MIGHFHMYGKLFVRPIGIPQASIKFEVSSSSSLKDMFNRMPKSVGLRELGHAHFQGNLFVCPLDIPYIKAAYQIWSLYLK